MVLEVLENCWVETYVKDFPAYYSIGAKMEDKPVHSMHNLSFNNYPNTQFKKIPKPYQMTSMFEFSHSEPVKVFVNELFL